MFSILMINKFVVPPPLLLAELVIAMFSVAYSTQFEPDDDNLLPGKIIMIYLLTSNVDCQL